MVLLHYALVHYCLGIDFLLHRPLPVHVSVISTFENLLLMLPGRSRATGILRNIPIESASTLPQSIMLQELVLIVLDTIAAN